MSNSTFVKDGLYHAETGIPWHLFSFMSLGYAELEYGPHAREAALNDRFGKLTSVPLSYTFRQSEIFEVEVEEGCLVKFCARIQKGFTVAPQGSPRDLILVCTPSRRRPGALFVKTLWLNLRSDSHRTLDKSKYIPYNS